MCVLNTMALQAVMYLIFVVTFQYLTESLRMKEEFFFDKMIADTFLENTDAGCAPDNWNVGKWVTITGMSDTLLDGDIEKN